MKTTQVSVQPMRPPPQRVLMSLPKVACWQTSSHRQHLVRTEHARLGAGAAQAHSRQVQAGCSLHTPCMLAAPKGVCGSVCTEQVTCGPGSASSPPYTLHPDP